MDEDDQHISEGARRGLDIQIVRAGLEMEIERLQSVVNAQRRILIQWVEAYKELEEQTKFLIK